MDSENRASHHKNNELIPSKTVDESTEYKHQQSTDISNENINGGKFLRVDLHDLRNDALASPFEFKFPRAPKEGGSVQGIVCHVCQKGLAHMNGQRQQQHLNRCMDKAEKQNKALAASLVMDCPLCGKNLKTEKQRKIHLKICGKSSGLKPQEVLEKIKKQETDPQESHNTVATLQVKPEAERSKQQKRGKKKAKTKTKQSWENDEELQVAMAISASLTDSENKNVVCDLLEGKVKKKKKGIKSSKLQTLTMPVLLSRSDEERNRITIDRFSNILEWNSDEEDDDQLALPPSRLMRCTQSSSKSEIRYWDLAKLSENCSEELIPKQSQKHSMEDDKSISILTQTKRTIRSVSEQNESLPNTCKILAELAADNMTQSQQVSNSEPWHRNRLVESFSSLIDNEFLSDVKIYCENDTIINAHTFIIQLRCPDLYKNLSQVDNTWSCDLTSYSRSCVLAFVSYMYAANIDISVFVIPELISLLKRFRMEGLDQLCQSLEADRQDQDVQFISKDLDELMEGIEDEEDTDVDNMSCSDEEEMPHCSDNDNNKDRTIEISRECTEISDKPTDMHEECTEISDRLTDMHEECMEISDKAVDIHGECTEVLDKSSEILDKPIETDEEILEIPDKSIEIHEECTETLDKSSEILDKPIEIHEECTDFLDKPIEEIAAIPGKPIAIFKESAEIKQKSKGCPQPLDFASYGEIDNKHTFHCIASTPVVKNFHKRLIPTPMTSPIIESSSLPFKCQQEEEDENKPHDSPVDLTIKDDDNVNDNFANNDEELLFAYDQDSGMWNESINVNPMTISHHDSNKNFNLSPKCIDLTINEDKDQINKDNESKAINKDNDSKMDGNNFDDLCTEEEQEFMFAYDNEDGVWNASGDVCDLTGEQPEQVTGEEGSVMTKEKYLPEKEKLSDNVMDINKQKKEEPTTISPKSDSMIDVSTSLASPGTQLRQDALEFSCTQSFLLDLRSGKLNDEQLWGGCVVNLTDCQKETVVPPIKNKKKKKPATKGKQSDVHMPEVDALNTPALKKELGQFGVKALSKKQGKTLLKEIYKQSEIDKHEKTTANKQVAKPVSHDISESDKSSAEQSESETTDDEDNPLYGENLVCSPTKPGQNVDVLLSEFIKQRPMLHTRILLYEAIDFSKLHQDIVASGMKCSKAYLIQFLDKKCVNFRFTETGNQQRKSRVKKKPKRKPKSSS